MAYENNEQNAFFLEDDTSNEYKYYWNKILSEYIVNKPRNCNCLTFFNSNVELTKKMIASKNVYVNNYYHNWHSGTCCYFMTRNAIEIIYTYYIKNEKINISNITNRLSLLADVGLIYPLLNTYHICEPTFIDSFGKGKNSYVV